ncbi:MAG: helix-turn-helix transcriptional regulator [Aerococcus sp.]|nr:helix-turn-helix transcriptional regulator [Aerococcus sp.]
MSKTYPPLDQLINSTGLKLTAIADRLGVDTSTLYKWRVYPNTIGIDEMESLAKITGVSFLDIYKITKKFKQEVAKKSTVNQ